MHISCSDCVKALPSILGVRLNQIEVVDSDWSCHRLSFATLLGRSDGNSSRHLRVCPKADRLKPTFLLRNLYPKALTGLPWLCI